MTSGHETSPAALGFLSVLAHDELGLVGGYLILNWAGRPLEFHCTAPVKPNRAQQILFGPTLEPYLYGEQIGQTLVAKGTCSPVVVCTNVERVLAVRSVQPEHPEVSVVLALEHVGHVRGRYAHSRADDRRSVRSADRTRGCARAGARVVGGCWPVAGHGSGKGSPPFGAVGFLFVLVGSRAQAASGCRPGGAAPRPPWRSSRTCGWARRRRAASRSRSGDRAARRTAGRSPARRARPPRWSSSRR